jgi:hypothetical protein
MYTEEMAKAFHAITPPEGFAVDLYDNDQFITIMVDPASLVGLDEAAGQTIVQYILDVKKALEDLGAMVLVVREVYESGESN